MRNCGAKYSLRLITKSVIWLLVCPVTFIFAELHVGFGVIKCLWVSNVTVAGNMNDTYTQIMNYEMELTLLVGGSSILPFVMCY